MNTTKIGFFDSGIGGATVLKECLKINPDFEYVFFSDSINNPYGDKEPEEIKKITENITKYLINENCKIIVIACNTASAMASNYLREKFKDVKFVAIEPAIKLAYNIKGSTLVMATKGTLDSEKFHDLYNEYHTDECYLMPCVGLANLIECGDEEQIDVYLKEHLKKYKNIKNVVLGCTHYPLVKNKIKEILNCENILDGSLGVAKQLNRIIMQNGYLPNNDDDKKIKFIDSSNSKEKEKRFYNFIK